MNQQLFQQFNRITQLGVLTFFILLLDLGWVLYHKLTYVEKHESWCVVVDDNHENQHLNIAETKGKALFLEKCASCHNNNMLSDMTGPALYGVRERWQDDEGALHQWIQNSQKLAEEGHPRAQQMINWSPTVMTAFESLDSAQIEAILAYIEVK